MNGSTMNRPTMNRPTIDRPTIDRPTVHESTKTFGRSHRLRVFVATLVVAVIGVATPGSAFASGGQDNSAVAVNTKDGSSVFKFAFSVARVMGDTVTSTNAAVAYASCTDCQTTAIAIQIVIVEGDPSTFTPTNTAIAINEACNLCDTLASAYQFVVQASGPVHFNADGNQQLHEIRRQLADLRQANLSGPEIQARLDELMGQLRQVLATDLVAAGKPGEDAAEPATGSADATTTTSEPSSTSTTARPAGSTSTSTSTTSPSTTSTTRPTSTTTAQDTTSTTAPSTTSSTTP
ncbi:MAG: putative peptide zinc metalloprotease protein [Acidimicrobiaceae bacterium]|nr:putative peptide zinc metalloprotease protein [Acidimicrobiaceae bacterium]